jgi:uncharacterized protein (TIGR02001 family)
MRVPRSLAPSAPVIARAAVAASAVRGSRTSAARSALFFAALFSPAPAVAQAGATVSAFSDARFRGYSLSEGRPVGVLDFAYDDPSGLYVGASASGIIRHGGEPAPFALQVDGGYSKRLESGTTLDVGITHSNYARYSAAHRGNSYTELYAGIAHGALSSRLFVSPHYFEAGRWTAYGEVNARISPASNWGINAHAGMLVTMRAPYAERYRPDFDWSLGVTRQLGRVSLHATWSDGAPGHDFYRDRRHSRSALVLGATFVL